MAGQSANHEEPAAQYGAIGGDLLSAASVPCNINDAQRRATHDTYHKGKALLQVHILDGTAFAEMIL